MNTNKGQINIPLLALVAVIGIITYLLITGSFNFKNRLFSSLYNKTPSQAFDGVQVHSEDKNLTSSWKQDWNTTSYLNGWDQINFSCNTNSEDNILNLTCQQASMLRSKISLSKNSSITITGSILAQNSNASIGLTNSSSELAKITTSNPEANDFQLPASEKSQSFRLISSLINNERFVFYYLGDSPEPLKKGPIASSEDLKVFLACQGSCSFGPLIISGVPIN